MMTCPQARPPAKKDKDVNDNNSNSRWVENDKSKKFTVILLPKRDIKIGLPAFLTMILQKTERSEDFELAFNGVKGAVHDPATRN
jgi:hypothetical protein